MSCIRRWLMRCMNSVVEGGRKTLLAAEVFISRILRVNALCELKGCFIDAGVSNRLSTQITAGVYNVNTRVSYLFIQRECV